MSAVLPLPSTPHEAGLTVGAPSLLQQLLNEQQRTAVETFAQWDGRSTLPRQARHYRDLLPATPPGPGQQYAFDVDLDACSGCKACVAACHSLNGLDPGETWRSVGLLVGGTSQLPVLQHVTTACHHCIEPACLDGCPVEAYEKDPITGIVRHLDDQCIGCQYCVLKCPYDVPKYHHAKGIVRKCDMCRERLVAGEAPACVQSCPTQAIRITVVNLGEATECAEGNLFLPGAPEPGYTLPTTVYRTQRPLPRNLLPADYYATSPQHAHWPLVFMLVLTQLSVGALCLDQLLAGISGARAFSANPATQTLHLGTALGFGLLGLAASVLHLGRPHLAYRAIIGWRTSWLSREVLAFGAFAFAATFYAAAPWLAALGVPSIARWQPLLGGAVSLCGLLGIVSSTMIYASTRRPFWNAAYTGLKFLLTAAVLGLPTALLVRLGDAYWLQTTVPPDATRFVERGALVWLMGVVAVKLAVEAAVFTSLNGRTLTPLRRTALLMTGRLARATWVRFLVGILGGIAIPLILLAVLPRAGTSNSFVPLSLGAMGVALTLNLIGELLERYLFFAAVVAPKMPGAPAS